LLWVRRVDILAFVQLNQSYENYCFYVDHRPGDGRVPEFLRAEERRANGCFQRVDDSRHFDDHQEKLHHEELEHQEEHERFG